MESEIITMQDIFEYVQTGRSAEGVEGYFRTTGIRPYCLDTIESMGIKLPNELFRGDRV
jgi:pilus assembly protein CpaF